MRVVLDTNILARASYSPTGPAGECLHRLRDPAHVLILSTFILDELDRVLRYPRLQRLHGLTDQEIGDYVRDVQDAALVVTTSASVSGVVASDPDDDPVVATAEGGNADVIDYCRQCSIEVLTDVELLQRLRATP